MTLNVGIISYRYAETAKALIKEADKVVFVGSSPVGKLVMKEAAETLTPVVLELGGW